MSEFLPAELELRCERILASEEQGEPLAKSDYAWFIVITLVLPFILIAIGASL